MATKRKLKRKVIVVSRKGGTISLHEIEKRIEAYNAKIIKSASASALTARNKILLAA